jgi:hypothetical protein
MFYVECSSMFDIASVFVNDEPRHNIGQSYYVIKISPGQTHFSLHDHHILVHFLLNVFAIKSIKNDLPKAALH